ncbi:hypothetical protein PVAG01_06499 [Phlyctema vagabunda]|uniref:Uncharacterized protein n=1 Tax=Phlyctema vagabunda TaxID=108571 RepID=A0ABR4PG86_9HELO
MPLQPRPRPSLCQWRRLQMTFRLLLSSYLPGADMQRRAIVRSTYFDLHKRISSALHLPLFFIHNPPLSYAQQSTPTSSTITNLYNQPTNQPNFNMSDNLRKGLGEQTKEKVTPDSQKSYTQQASENITGAADKVAGAAQPEGDKSVTQKAGDATRGNADSAQNNGKGYVESAKDTAANLANAASDTLNNAAESLNKKA